MRIYNIITYFWHRILHRPIRLKKIYDTKTKKPKLTVIFLHGIAANSSTWRATVNILAKNPEFSSVRFIALDLLGFGKSLKAEWLNYDYDEYDSALNRTIRHLHIKTPIVLVGHSMGSLIAADFATNHMDRIAKLILVSPPVLKPAEAASLPDKFYLKSYSSIHKISNEPAIKALANFVQKVSSFRAEYLNTVAFERSMKNIVLNPKNYQTYKKLKIPTAIIHGRLDALVMRQNLVEIAKANSNFITLHQVIAQHDISPSKRDKIAIELKDFLQNETL